MLSLTMKQTPINIKRVCRSPGECLVVSFEDSVPPVVWQVDLEKAHSLSFGLRSKGDTWELGYIEGRAEFAVMAVFDHRDDAQDAYDAVQKALMKKGSCYRHTSGAGFWLLVIIAAFALVVAGGRLLMSDKAVKTVSQSVSTVNQSVSKIEQDRMKDGVPVSADDVLQTPP